MALPEWVSILTCFLFPTLWSQTGLDLLISTTFSFTKLIHTMICIRYILINFYTKVKVWSDQYGLDLQCLYSFGLLCFKQLKPIESILLWPLFFEHLTYRVYRVYSFDPCAYSTWPKVSIYSFDFSAGHGGSGGVQCYAGAIHEEGGWVPAGLLRHWPPQLPEHTEFPHSDP